MNLPSPLNQKELAKYYQQGFSMKQLADKLNCSEHKIVYWMDKYKINRRNRSDALYIRLNPAGDPFQIKTILTSEECKLYGLGIYWGEGEKNTKHQLRVANTDPDVIQEFAKFLSEICLLKKEKIFYYLICFNDSNSITVAQYWSKKLGISHKGFGKIVQIPQQGKGTYKRKSQFGVCTLVVSNIKLKTWIMTELEKYRQFSSLDSLVVKHTLGKGETVSSILTPGSSSIDI